MVRDKYKYFETVECMDFGDLEITGIAENAFNGLENLQQLNLSYNEISNIEEVNWDGLENLQMLWLYENKITNKQKEELMDALPNVTIKF